MVDTVLPGSGPPMARRSYVVDAVTGFAFDAAGVAAPGASTGALTAGGTPPLLAVSALAVGARDATGGVMVTRALTLLRPGGGPDTTIRIRTQA
ncbi:hypothetical protein LP419_06210 [Massilia sp. H-1]|nr:hypothetical protein LP419_06210 [Massilia sp. H-1]